MTDTISWESFDTFCGKLCSVILENPTVSILEAIEKTQEEAVELLKALGIKNVMRPIEIDSSLLFED